MDILTDTEAVFKAYYLSYPRAEMNDLKWAHTRRVATDAKRIAEGEGLTERLARLGLLAAWLHDTGRFEQFRRFATFSDRVSVNHALMSCAEVLRLGWLDALPADDRNLVLRAIECHNMKEIPPGLPEDEQIAVHLVRDADKLDICTLLDLNLKREGYLESHPEIYWGLAFAAPPSEAVTGAILAGREVDYADIRSVADFVLIQVGWCVGGLHYTTSRRLAAERGTVGTRERFLLKIVPESADIIRRCCDLARARAKEAGHGA